jgi:DNA-binding winged helix-turn-helix (wHTH) protein/tetratricopeptide (TPR) repeat protein
MRDASSPATGAGCGGESLACSFADFLLQADGTLRRGDALVHLPPRELAALRLLLVNAGQVVSPLHLKLALWGDVHVTADSLPKCLSSLRARLGPEAFIQTVYKRGYRFTAEVKRHGAASAEVLQRLAILPFANGNSVPEHLGHAIAEETIARLSNVRYPTLAVLARDSVFSLVSSGLTAQQVGQALKADLVMTGTIRALASQFRLRAEMIRVEDGAQIWVEDLLVDQSRIAGLELELAQRLAWRLGAGVLGDGSSPLGSYKDGLSISAAAAAPQVELTFSSHRRVAYEIFLLGRHEWQSLHRHRMQDGLQHLFRAIELDPTLIPAKVDLVHLCVSQAFYGFMAPSVAAELVRRTAETIPDIARQAEAILPALGWLNFHFDHNLSAALRDFSLSAHLPHAPWTTRVRAMFALSRRRNAEAIALLREAIHQDPYAPWLLCRLAWAFHLDGQAAESVDNIRTALNLFPEHEFTNFYGALILAFNGEAVTAIELAQGLVHRLPYFDPATAVHAYALACAGRADEAHSILERLQWLSRERFLLTSFTAAAYVALGDMDAALAELRVAEHTRCPWFFQMLADPRLKPLHGNPEFERMRAILAGMEAEAERKAPFKDGPNP